MSSTTIPASSSSSDAILIVGTPQHEEYYYKKIERFIYSHMAACVEKSPDISMTKTWLALGDDGQHELIDNIKRCFKYGVSSLDIEDDELVSNITFVFIGCQLADIAIPTPKRNKPIGKATKKSGNHLLKTAIFHARLEKQDQ